jgi:hypothetical protein
MKPPTLYEAALKLNTLRALLSLRVGMPEAAGRLADAELEVYSTYELIGEDRDTWVLPLIQICRGISVLIHPDEEGARGYNEIAFREIVRSFEQFEAVHGDDI